MGLRTPDQPKLAEHDDKLARHDDQQHTEGGTMTIRAHERNAWVIVYWDRGPDSEQDVIVARFGGRHPLTDAYKDAAYLMASLRETQP